MKPEPPVLIWHVAPTAIATWMALLYQTLRKRRGFAHMQLCFRDWTLTSSGLAMTNATQPESEPILIVEHDGPVAIVRLNRPRVRNALNQALMGEMTDTLESLGLDSNTRVIVLTGDERAFAAGADISEMVDATVAEMHQRPNLARWDRMRRVKKPIIAAVAGFALGGGCELAMICDMIVAAESARFGQPEINLGIIPGGGGTQRLVLAIGKARAMELILTGRTFSAAEAFDAGLITKVVPSELYLVEAMRLAHEIASKPPMAVQLAKDTVLKAFDSSLETGLDYERRGFNLLFATDDRREGMRAFLEKRKPKFSGK